jgi:hypothetical protein
MTGVSALKSFTGQSESQAGAAGRSQERGDWSLMIRWASAQTGWPHDVCDGGRGRSGMKRLDSPSICWCWLKGRGQDDTRQ